MTPLSPSNFFRAWRTFIDERFPPAANGLMAICFALGNSRLATAWADQPIPFVRIPAIALATLLFFFRLRCFDEIKDFLTDLERHPRRPLARGLLSPRQVKQMAFGMAMVELFLIMPLGARALAIYAVAVAYSYLMYREFFIGGWLRPRLTLYAVSHTAVSMPLGWAIAAMALAGTTEWFSLRVALFGVVNWMLFNVFEFGRKSFAPREERPDEDSYSSLYGTRGAAALCLSQVAIALAVLIWLGEMNARQWAVAGTLLLCASIYAHRATLATAKAYRLATGIYVVAFYLFILFPGNLAEGGDPTTAVSGSGSPGRQPPTNGLNLAVNG